MNGDTIDIYYFSGTGNTLLAVNCMVEVFRRNNKTVNLYKIEKFDPAKVNLSNVVGLAFPVAVLSTYPFVWEFFDALPQAHGTEVFMLDTLAGISGGIVGPLKKLLNNRGYTTIGAFQAFMPGNYGKSIPSKKKIAAKRAKMQRNVAKYAEKLLVGKAHWRRVPIFSDIVRLLSRSKSPWKSMGKHITIDKKLCTQCGICPKLCPTKCIEMQEFPQKHEGCVGCMRCVGFCPSNAILYKGKRDRYHAVDLREINS